MERHSAASDAAPRASWSPAEARMTEMRAVSAEPTSFGTVLMARKSFLLLHQDSSSRIFHRLEHYSLF